ncbi:hypothetical protein [Almyronema epifaneia]|uniref:Armadillo-type fold-containing protein n=1 Tax=Almyronema epifaneia S1 TaxID=2991925 RepID=A0ABW6IC26_9CYAN
MALESSWQEMLTSVEIAAHKLTRSLKREKAFSSRVNQTSAQTLWLAGLTGFVLATSNWRLLAAMSVGIGSIRLINWLADEAHWQLFEQSCEKLWLQLKQPTVMTAASGLAMSIAAYGVLSLWSAVDNPWLALGLLTPTGLSLATLALLLWQFKASAVHTSPESDPHQLLAQLTHSDPLRRLVAIQRLIYWLDPTSSQQTPYDLERSTAMRSQIIDCFRVLLVQESDPIVRNTLRAGLQATSATLPQLSQGAPPLQLESVARVSALRSPLRRSQTEYVESV